MDNAFFIGSMVESSQQQLNRVLTRQAGGCKESRKIYLASSYRGKVAHSTTVLLLLYAHHMNSLEVRSLSKN